MPEKSKRSAAKAPAPIEVKKTSRRHGGTPNVASILVQCVMGGAFFAIWAFVAYYMDGESMVQVGLTTGPYFAFFVLGVLSRYVPGVKTLAKQFDTAR